MTTLYRKIRHAAGILLRVRWMTTVYLNLRLLPFSTAVKLPFAVTGRGKMKFRKLTGLVEFRCPVRFGLVVIGKDVDNMPAAFAPTQLFLAGRWIIHGPVIINRGANVVIWPDSTMEFGEYVLICSGVTVKSVQRVAIGKHAMISSGCFIMDSNIHCIRDMETGLIKRPTNPIEIGDYCWLSMNASVLGGGKIPSHSVLTRYCFVNQDITQNGGGDFCGCSGQIVKKRPRETAFVYTRTNRPSLFQG